MHWSRPVDYVTVWEAMKAFTAQRHESTFDEIWLVEHLPVYTLGQAGKPEHILQPGQIPIVQTDRGGQVTYHGPGQVVAYVMADLRRSKRFVKEMVAQVEQAVIDTLVQFGIQEACRKPGAPGIYVPFPIELAKIAALGLKIRQGCSYHGVALNVNMDLGPFLGINPCGYEGLRTISMASCGVKAEWDEVASVLSGQITQHCGLRVK